MKKAIKVFMIICLLLTTGCHWFISGQIKRETSLMNLNIKTALKEIDMIEKSDKPEAQKTKEIKEKAMRTLRRAAPHTENIYNYTHGRPSTK